MQFDHIIVVRNYFKKDPYEEQFYFYLGINKLN